MNGLAAWFNGSNDFLNNAALLGSLILLSVALFSAATHKIKVEASTIGIWFFFAAMIGMKGTATVTNVYTQQVTQIANVPALVLLPASTFSTAAWKVFTTMETSFQSTSGSYMSVQANGFAGPLEILLALRSPAVSPIDTNLRKTLEAAIKDCTINPNGQTTASTPFENSMDMLLWLQTFGRQTGLTTQYTASAPDGIAMTCGDTFTYLNTTFDSYVASPAIAALINRSVSTAKPTTTLGRNGAGQGIPVANSWDATSLTGAWDMLIGSALSSQQSAYQFSKNALIASTVTYSLECLGNSNNIVSPANCTTASLINAEAIEGWKSTASAAGSGFLKTMFTSLGFLQILFFSLFPVVAVYALVVAQNTAKVFGGYIFFGIWTQSWMLVIAPVQAYIQNNVIDAMQKTMATDGGLTLANANAVYTVLSTKLALAADTMASSQMLSLALLSGSLFSLNAIAQKWSGRENIDAADIQPGLMKNSDMSTASAQTQKVLLGTGSGNAGVVLSGGNYLDDFSGATSFVKNTGTSSSLTNSKTNTQGHSTDIGTSVSQSTGINFTSAEQSNMQKAYETSIAGTAGISGSIAGAMMKNIGAGKNLSAAEEAAGGAVIQKAQSQAAKELAAKDSSFLSKLSSDDAAVKSQAWGQVASHAVDILTTGAMAAELIAAVPSLGGTAALEPATLAAGMAGRTAAKAAVESYIKKNAGNKAAGVAQGTAIAADKGAGFLNAIAGNTSSNAQAAVRASAANSDSWNAQKGRSSDARWSSDMSEKVSIGVQAAQQKAYGESASKGQTTTTQLALTTDSLVRIASEGDGTSSAQEIREGVARGLTQAKIGKSAEDIEKAEYAVNQNLSRRNIVGTAGASAGEIKQFMHDAIMQKILDGKVTMSPSFSKGEGPAAGAHLLGDTHSGQFTPGKAATQGHWGPVQAAPSGSGSGGSGAGQGSSIAPWWKPGDPASENDAKSKGMRWVPGTPAVAATEKPYVEPSQSFQNIGPGVGGLNKSGAQVLGEGNAKIDKELATAPTANEALRENQKEGVAQVEGRERFQAGVTAVAAAINIGANAVAGAQAGNATPGGGNTQPSGGKATPGSGEAEETPSRGRRVSRRRGG